MYWIYYQLLSCIPFPSCHWWRISRQMSVDDCPKNSYAWVDIGRQLLPPEANVKYNSQKQRITFSDSDFQETCDFVHLQAMVVSVNKPGSPRICTNTHAVCVGSIFETSCCPAHMCSDIVGDVRSDYAVSWGEDDEELCLLLAFGTSLNECIEKASNRSCNWRKK